MLRKVKMKLAMHLEHTLPNPSSIFNLVASVVSHCAESIVNDDVVADLQAVKDRLLAPSGYGTVELSKSSGTDACFDVVEALYSKVVKHIDDSADEPRIIRHNVEGRVNVKIVFVPEGDLEDLMRVHQDAQVHATREKFRKSDGCRRCLSFFWNNGERVKLSGDRDPLARV